jgi:hypothetical protein
MSATLNLSEVSSWVQACIVEWDGEWERTQDSYWKGKADAARVIQDALLTGEFESAGQMQQSLVRWNEGDQVDLYIQNSETKEPVVGATVKTFDDQGNPVNTSWSGTQGATYYALRPADIKKEMLKLRFRVPGYLSAMVLIPNGQKTAHVGMMPDTNMA